MINLQIIQSTQARNNTIKENKANTYLVTSSKLKSGQVLNNFA